MKELNYVDLDLFQLSKFERKFCVVEICNIEYVSVNFDC